MASSDQEQDQSLAVVWESIREADSPVKLKIMLDIMGKMPDTFLLDDSQPVIDSPTFAALTKMLNRCSPLHQPVFAALARFSQSARMSRVISDWMIDSDHLSNLYEASFPSSVSSELSRHCIALIANSTRHEDAAQKHVTFLLNSDNSSHLDRLIQSFVTVGDATTDSAVTPSIPDHSGQVLLNLSQVRSFRDHIASSELFEKLFSFTTHDAPSKRHSAVGILRNCCMDDDRHESWFSGADGERNDLATDFVSCLLLPLCHPRGFDADDNEKLPVDLQYLDEATHRAERLIDIKIMLIEALHQLLSIRKGRDFLKRCGCYVVLREAHKQEKNEGVQESIENAVDILINDEPEAELLDEAGNLKAAKRKTVQRAITAPNSSSL